MLNSGDIVDLDLGRPEGREAGFLHPAVLITGQGVLDSSPSVVQVVPLTSTIRPFNVEVVIEPDEANGLAVVSAAQCQHLRSVSTDRILAARGNIGALALAQIRETVAVLLDLP
jgi:mRNA interferase MazF